MTEMKTTHQAPAFRRAVPAQSPEPVIIGPVSGWFDFRLAELWRYRDLIMMFVWRDFIAIYKQTILGPLWYLIQPLLTTLVFVVVFGAFASLSTDGLPATLFYLSGVVMWRYFADCLQKTSNTFVANANLFGKVYFPRMVIPISVLISSLIAFIIQLVLLGCFWIFYAWQGTDIHIHPAVILFPLLIVQTAALGLGCGILVSSLTIKYRDFAQLVSFGVQLWMYATPVLYPASIIPVKWQWVIALNPMSPIIEAFRLILLGQGTVELGSVLSSILLTVIVLGVGFVSFNRIEKSFQDTV